jgi:hypothetical protein
MRLVTLFTALTAALIATSAAIATLPARASTTPARAPDLSSGEAILRWINGYRAKPDVADVPAVVRALSAFSAFKDPESSGVYVGFIAGVLAANPSKADDLIARMFPLPEQDQWVVVRAVAYSGLPQWKQLLHKYADRMPARRVMIEKLVAGKLPTLDQMAFDKNKGGFMDTMKGYFTFGETPAKQVELELSPDVLDTLWGYYFGTRAYAPIATIMAMLPMSKDRDSADKLTIGSMAKYTLASNAARDSELLGVLKWSRNQQPKEIAPILDEVIEAAESVDTARVRKEALAAIEELKRKGPGSKRDVAWWGQLGQGAVGVGCVAAAASGVAAVVGIPCVVGGAVGSAALNFWGKEP